MTRILFVCLGNICRSVTAEFLFRELARREDRENDFSVDSAGTSDEEEGHDIYPPGPNDSDGSRHPLRAPCRAAHHPG